MNAYISDYNIKFPAMIFFEKDLIKPILVTVSSLLLSSTFLLGQIKMHNDTKVSIGTLNPNYGQDVQVNLVANSIDRTGLYIKTEQSVDWKQSIVAEVNRDNSVSYVMKRMNSQGGVDKFYVFGTGTVFAAGTYYTSDRTLKENIQPINDASSVLTSLEGVRFNFNDKFYSDKHTENSKIGDYYKKPQLGFIAQEVEKVAPELVITTNTGVKALAYANVSALLVEGFKEHNSRIDSLESRIHELESYLNSLKDNSLGDQSNASGHSSTRVTSNHKLFQNQPNPFSRETLIRYSIGEHDPSDHFEIRVFDSNGKEHKRATVNTSQNTLRIDSSGLAPGIYAYSLFMNGVFIDSKMMILIAN